MKNLWFGEKRTSYKVATKMGMVANEINTIKKEVTQLSLRQWEIFFEGGLRNQQDNTHPNSRVCDYALVLKNFLTEKPKGALLKQHLEDHLKNYFSRISFHIFSHLIQLTGSKIVQVLAKCVVCSKFTEDHRAAAGRGRMVKQAKRAFVMQASSIYRVRHPLILGASYSLS